MNISELLLCRIAPFEVEDQKLKKLFSFFLHLAPSIDSSSAYAEPACGMALAWDNCKKKINLSTMDYHIYASSPGNLNDSQLRRYSLYDTDAVNRKSKHLACCFKQNETDELACLLRHIRNAIAHSNVFLVTNRRKYVLFDDYNTNKNLTARILFSQTDLEYLRKALN